MKVKTAKFFIVLTVVAALLLSGPAWAVPKKGGTVCGGDSPAVTSAGTKRQNRLEKQVPLENAAKVEEQHQGQTEEQEQNQEQNEEQNRVKVKATSATTGPKGIPQGNRVGQQIFVNGQPLKEACCLWL